MVAPTDPKAAERRASILAAARETFAEKGYEGTAVADIVSAAGIAQGTFYLYFPSKQDAFFALAESFYAEMAGHVGAALGSGDSFAEQIRSITRSCFAAAKQNADLVGLVFFGADSVSTEAQRRFSEANPVVDALLGMIQTGVAAGEFDIGDPEVTARLLVGLVRTALLEAFVLGDGSDADRLERTTAQMFASTLGVAAR